MNSDDIETPEAVLTNDPNSSEVKNLLDAMGITPEHAKPIIDAITLANDIIRSLNKHIEDADAEPQQKMVAVHMLAQSLLMRSCEIHKECWPDASTRLHLMNLLANPLKKLGFQVSVSKYIKKKKGGAH